MTDREPLRLTVKRHKHREGWGGRLWLPWGFFEFGWFRTSRCPSRGSGD